MTEPLAPPAAPEPLVASAAPEFGPAEAVPSGMGRLRARVKGSETVRAAGLAGAMIATNAVALLLTIVFGRLLGTEGYGEVAAMLSAFLILSVPGQAMQLATARAGSLGRLGDSVALRANLDRWTHRLILLTVALAGVGVLARVPLANAIGVSEQWGAAATLPTGALWLLLSVQRGALLAVQAYKPVGVSMVAEQAARLGFGAPLALAGLDATGAFLGTPVAMIAVAIVLDRTLHHRLKGDGGPRAVWGIHRLRDHVRGAGAPIIGLTIVAVLQNVDVIVAKHRLDDSAAGAYAAAAVAAKVVIWVAVGIALWVVPEATRRLAASRDPAGVLIRGMAVLAVAALPTLVLFASAPRFVLKVAFGPKFAPGGDALLVLSIAMILLAASYLAVQYLLALGHWRFLLGLVIVAAAEPFVLTAPAADRVGIAGAVLAVQGAAAICVAFAVAVARRGGGRRTV